MTASALERFLGLVRREMRAADVRLLTPEEEGTDAPNVIQGLLPDGRRVAVVFPEPPEDRAARTRRLQMLLHTFAQSLEEAREQAKVLGSGRPPLARSLQDELRALAKRARALDALVIDANSPIVWGSAVAQLSKGPPPAAVSLIDVSRGAVSMDEDSGPGQDREPESSDDSAAPAAPAELPEVTDHSQRAATAVRALPAIATLHKGGHLHQITRESDLAYAAHSFAGIYVLVLVYDAPFDELRSERVVSDALPRIERLVLALPPFDPPPAPMAGVVSLRRRRR